MTELLIPIAISSQLDVTGEERIHAAAKSNSTRPSYVPPPQSTYIVSVQAFNGSTAPAFWRMQDGTTTLAQITGDNPAFATSTPAMSAQADYCMFGGTVAPYLSVMKRSGNSYTTLSGAFDVTPADATNSSYQCVGISADGLYAAAWDSHSANKLYVYKRSADTFALQTTPATVPPQLNATNGDSATMKWSPTGTYLAIVQRTQGTGQGTSTYIYKNVNGVLTLLAQPDIQISSVYGNSIAWSPSEDVLAIAYATQADLNTTSKVALYKRSGDTFSLLALPTKSGRSATSCAFSADGTQMAVGTWGAGPGVLIYSRSGDVFTEVTTTLPSDSSITSSVGYTKDGSVLLRGTSLGYTMIGVSGGVYTVLGTGATPTLMALGHPL